MKEVHITIAENGESGIFIIKPYKSYENAIANLQKDAEEVGELLKNERLQSITITLTAFGTGVISNGQEDVTIEIFTETLN